MYYIKTTVIKWCCKKLKSIQVWYFYKNYILIHSGGWNCGPSHQSDCICWQVWELLDISWQRLIIINKSSDLFPIFLSTLPCLYNSHCWTQSINHSKDIKTDCFHSCWILQVVSEGRIYHWQLVIILQLFIVRRFCRRGLVTWSLFTPSTTSPVITEL